jgi:O-antigen/teichoic acid export membrane protein
MNKESTLASAVVENVPVPAVKAADKDLTGMDRLTWNVISSWAAHVVFIVAGFIMPRMIDRHIGQVSLGVWDFSWSLVNYFTLAGLGVGSAVNRHVAMYRAAGDKDTMRRIVTSVVYLQVAIGALVLLMTAVSVWVLPWFFAARLQDELIAAQWVVALLGGSLAVQMSFDSFRGIITGCHRWDLHNGLNAGSYALTVICMFVALANGHGLRMIAGIYLLFNLATELIRVALAHRVCPELKIRPRFANWTDARQMLVYGGNTMVSGMTPLILSQATSLLIASHLGPAALALFSRPTGLVRSAQTFLNKFAFVLTPTAGSLLGKGRTADVRRLLSQATRMSVALSLPMVLLMAFQGDIILHLWMGKKYEQGFVLAVLALGSFIPMTQQSVMTILMGLNLHGRSGILSLSFGLAGLGVGVVMINAVGWSLPGAALLVAVPLALGNGVAIAIYACRRLEINLGEYARDALAAPAACILPFAITLLVARVVFHHHLWLAFLLGSGVGALLTAPLYYRYILPGQIKNKIARALSRRFGRSVVSATTSEVVES